MAASTFNIYIVLNLMIVKHLIPHMQASLLDMYFTFFIKILLWKHFSCYIDMRTQTLVLFYFLSPSCSRSRNFFGSLNYRKCRIRAWIIKIRFILKLLFINSLKDFASVINTMNDPSPKKTFQKLRKLASLRCEKFQHSSNLA